VQKVSCIIRMALNISLVKPLSQTNLFTVESNAGFEIEVSCVEVLWRDRCLRRLKLIFTFK